MTNRPLISLKAPQPILSGVVKVTTDVSHQSRRKVLSLLKKSSQ